MTESEQLVFEFDATKPIKGFPEIWWKGKHPYTSTQYFPAQKKERYGSSKEFVDKDGKTKDWINKIFWGDNIQVMSHLLKEFRGKVDLIYIDPPFDSKADYKKTIKMKGDSKGKEVKNDQTSFEQKQYGDIWSNDEYLQFMYERLILCRELLHEDGSIFLHCDWHRGHHLRMLLDEVFGTENFINEIAWCYYGPGSPGMRQFNRKHDTIFWYSKKGKWTFNDNDIRIPHDEKTSENFKQGLKGSGFIADTYELSNLGKIPEDWWEMAIAGRYPTDGKRKVGYPTEKPYKLLERIIKAASNKNDLVFDCFMGSGVTQAMAMQLGRRFIGADINLGSIQTTTKRLCSIQKEIESTLDKEDKFTGFEVYNVNNYDFFQNPVQAKELLIEALEMQKFDSGSVFDGEKDGYNVKILPVNRIATKADLEELKANLPFKTYAKRKEENPNEPVDKIMLVCMGHEPDLAGSFQFELSNWKFDIKIYDILLPENKQPLLLKRDSEAFIKKEGNKLVIKSFYPMNLMQKLSLEREKVDNWKQLTESVMIDWNYDGAVMEPTVMDVPEKDGLVSGVYDIPSNAGRIMVKITDLLSESIEVEVEVE